MTARGVKSASIIGPFRGTVIAPPGRGKTTLLVPALIAAGLSADGITCPDDIRLRRNGSADNFEHGSEIEKEARQVEEKRMLAGESVVRDSTGLNAKVRKAEVNRAHKVGVRAVAFLSSPLPLVELQRRNANRKNLVPKVVVAMFHDKHSNLSVEDLLSEGFDQVVVWNDRTTFTFP